MRLSKAVRLAFIDLVKSIMAAENAAFVITGIIIDYIIILYSNISQYFCCLAVILIK